MTDPLPQRLMLRNGIYYFRICVPKDISAALRKRLLVRSLRTSDVKLARAKLPYFIVAAESEFEVVRQSIRGSVPDLASPGVKLETLLGFHSQARDSASQAQTVAANHVQARDAVADGLDSKTSIQNEPATASALSIDDLFDQWERETKPSASTLSSWRGHKKHFKGFFNARADDLARIGDTDMVAWKNKLIDEGKAPATITRSYFGFAGAMFRYAVSNRLLQFDPTARIKVAGKAKAGTKMLGYTSEEVTTLLAHASVAIAPWKRWLPWLAAATGSRIGEMAQLHGAHIANENGIAVVRISPAPDAGSLKNAGSERAVPLHPALIEQGFLAFVAARGTGPLFYDRTSGDPKKKHASKSVTNRLAAWIRELGFKDKRKAPNHALRHWFKTECARLRIEDSVVDAIQGHADNSSAAVYRHISADIMRSALMSISLPPKAGDPSSNAVGPRPQER